MLLSWAYYFLVIFFILWSAASIIWRWPKMGIISLLVLIALIFLGYRNQIGQWIGNTAAQAVAPQTNVSQSQLAQRESGEAQASSPSADPTATPTPVMVQMPGVPAPTQVVVQNTERAKAASVGTSGTIVANSLHVRSGPGTQYQAIGDLSGGSSFTLYQQNGDWGKISQSEERWIHLGYTSLAQSPDSGGQQVTSGAWQITYYAGATNLMRNVWVFHNPNPSAWTQVPFPNEDNPAANFIAANGVEYGMAESAFCQQGQTCDFNTPSRSYRLFTGDYSLPGVDSCTASNGQGCALAVFNVGNVTAMWRNAKFDYGFTVSGLYWNGDKLGEAVSALMSSTASKMLNMTAGYPANRGANCSIPEGCSSARLFWAVTSGNEVLVTGVTTVGASGTSVAPTKSSSEPVTVPTAVPTQASVAQSFGSEDCRHWVDEVAPNGTTCSVPSGVVVTTSSDVSVNGTLRSDAGSGNPLQVNGPSQIFCEWGCSFQ